MNPDLLPIPVLASSDSWVAIWAVGGFIVALIATGIILDRKRQKALAEAAAALGLSYSRKPDEALLAEFSAFPLSSQGRSNRFQGGVIEGELGGGIGVSVFDHQYTVGGGKNSSTYTSTVVALRLEGIVLPTFVLKEEGVHFSFFGLFKKPEDINFEDWPLFSDKFHLTGDDEAAVRRLFKPRVLEWFEQRLKLRVECAGEVFIVYRLRKRVKARMIPDAVKEAGELAALLVGSHMEG